jgi:hypothetical protein
MTEVKEMRGRVAIQSTLASILRTRYLPRDGVDAPLAQISCEGAPVSTDLIEEVVDELEDGIRAMEKEIRSILSEEV